MRKNNGIPRVVDLLDVDMTKPENSAQEPEGELSLDMKVARGGTYALWSLCRLGEEKEKQVMVPYNSSKSVGQRGTGYL